jgi:hypothetical protein
MRGTAGTDYYGILVNVPAVTTTGTVSVPTTQDNIVEADENFTIASGTKASSQELL